MLEHVYPPEQIERLGDLQAARNDDEVCIYFYSSSEEMWREASRIDKISTYDVITDGRLQGAISIKGATYIITLVEGAPTVIHIVSGTSLSQVMAILEAEGPLTPWAANRRPQ